MASISKHITLAEAIKSATATARKIDNTPEPAHLVNMKALAEHVFEPLRAGLGGHPIKVTSFYRSPKLNAGIRGASSTSQHCKGEAMDLVGTRCSNAEIFHYIKNNLKFDQMIWEHGTEKNPDWVHVSFSRTRNRGMILRAYKVGDETKYRPW